MQPLSALRPADMPRRDPAPSRAAYKMHRLLLTPVFRALFRVGLPALILATMAGWFMSNPDNREALKGALTDARRTIEERPEFTVKLMAIEGASPAVDQAIREMLPVNFPVSSFDLDLEVMQSEVASLDVVKRADVRIRPGGVLEIHLVERAPAVIWRSETGLELLDETGHRVASLTARSGRSDLALLAGQGAQDAVPEAMALLAAGSPILDHLRGLVRVGERRWDLVLERGQRILLPEENPVGALEQVIALDQAQDLLMRDIITVDMRNPMRPTLRIAPPAVSELRRIRGLERGGL